MPTAASPPASALHPAAAGEALSLVVPVFNSAEIVAALVAEIGNWRASCDREVELILIDDGSRDASWEAIEKLLPSHPWISAHRLMRNFGQHNAVLCGIRAARHPVIVTLDDDLQHPPREIDRLLAKLDEGCDVVYGTPRAEQHGLWRDLASRLTKVALRSAMGIRTAAQVSAFRAFRTALRDAFADYRGPFVSIDVLLTWGTTRFAAVTVEHRPRLAGTSHYGFRQLVAHAMNMMTGFSVLPLQIASLIGLAFTAFGGLVLLWVIGRYFLQGSAVPGFPFLASIIALFSGAQLFSLGIIGEYLARIHFRTMEKPPYVVRTVRHGVESEPGL